MHSSAVIVPAVLAACERFGRDGDAARCSASRSASKRCAGLALVTPKAIHDAGFHPTGVLGTIGCGRGRRRGARRFAARRLVDALGIAGSLAGGIIEYLAEGAWTKRLHAGLGAQSGVHAARLGAQGFSGPRTVFEGTHGLFSRLRARSPRATSTR